MLTSHKLAYSVAEAAVLADVCRDHIYTAIREGRLPARKAGRRTLIRRCDLENYLDALPTLELRGGGRGDKEGTGQQNLSPQLQGMAVA